MNEAFDILAVATILGQFISFVICIAYLRRSRVFRVKETFKLVVLSTLTVCVIVHLYRPNGGVKVAVI